MRTEDKQAKSLKNKLESMFTNFGVQRPKGSSGGFFLSKVRMKEAVVTGLIADQRKELPIADQCVLFSTHRILLRAALGSASSITTRRKLL